MIAWDPPPLGASAAARLRHVGRRGGWWHTPNRGLFRAEAFRATGGMRPHAAGEFAADWPWLIRLAGRGDFLRVPEVLCRKRYMRTSLTKTWSRGAEVWEALLDEALAATRAAPAPAWLRPALVAELRLRHARAGWAARLPEGVRRRLLRWTAGALRRVQ